MDLAAPRSLTRWKVFFAATALTRFLSCIPYLIDDDEAWWVVAARSLRAPWDFYLRAVDHKPPGVVWFYWFAERLLFFGQSGCDPRLMRAVFTALTVAAALLLGRLAVFFARGSDAAKGADPRLPWMTATLFLIAAALGSPKLLTTTFDGLLILFIIAAYGAVWLGAFRGRFLLAGALLGGALLTKQTAVFSALPLLFARWPRRLRAGELAAIAGGAVAVYLPAVVALHPAEFFYWNLTFPGQVLMRARESAFDSTRELLGSLKFFVVALFPLVYAAFRTQAGWRDFRLLWLLAGALGTFLGKGVFLHYFLLIVPPLVLLGAAGWARAGRLRPIGLTWLGLGYAWAVVTVALPGSALFWGDDLDFNKAVGFKIDLLVPPGAPVLIWGGTVMPLTFAHAGFVGKFLLPRFAEPPYDTPLTQAAFHAAFSAARPQLVVDLHERGDNRFNNPFVSDPFLAAEVAAHYRPYVSVGLPWAKFYLRTPPSAAAGLELLASPEALARASLPFPAEPHAWENFLRYASAHPLLSLKALRDLADLDLTLRAEAALDLIARQSQVPEVRGRAAALAASARAMLSGAEGEPGGEPNKGRLASGTEALLRQVAHGVPSEMALPWRSPLWWPESAIVELQPKFFKSP